jgi:hypothetical protein
MLKLKLPIDGLRRESVVQNRKRKHREEQQQNAKSPTSLNKVWD